MSFYFGYAVILLNVFFNEETIPTKEGWKEGRKGKKCIKKNWLICSVLKNA